MIFVLNEHRVRVGVIKDVVSAERLEEINGENTLDFSIKADSRAASLITNSSMFELDGQYFDLAVLKQEIDSSGENIISIEADHISYRLNHTDYDLDSFYRESTTSWILYGILNGTEFSSGGCEVGTIMKYDVKEKTSRRQLLMDFAELVGGELEFDEFRISIVEHRGSSTPTVVLKDKHINIVSRTFNNRTVNREGKSTITYQCTPIYDPSNVFNLGDEVELRQGSIGINETLRANRISINPYDPTATSFELTEYSTELKSSIRHIRAWSLGRGIKYAGVSIDTENGLLLDKPPTAGSPEQEDPPEAEILADNRWATIKINNVDGILVNTKDDAGDGTDQLYLEHDDEAGRTNLVFDGKLGDDVVGGLTIEKLPIEGDPRWADITLNDDDGILVNTKDDDGVGTDQLYLEHDDENGRTNLIFDGKLGDNVVTSDKYAGVALDSTNGLVIYKEATEEDPKQGIAVLNNKHGILVATKNDAGIQTDRLYLEHDEAAEETNLVFNGKLSDDVITNQLDPLYSGGGGGGGEVVYLNLRTTTLYADVSSSGAFVTNTWTHGYDLSTQIVRFFGAPKFYDENYIVEDWAIEIVSNTQVRIVGHVTVVS